MGKHHKHKVKVHQWQRGRLTVKDYEFANFEDAVTFANNQQRNHKNTVHEIETDQVVKIYDTEDDSLVLNVGIISDPSYA